MQKSNYEVDVLVNGRQVKEYAHKSKTYIEGKKGTEFSLRLRNNSWSRKLFVVSIDGLSIIDGEDASYESSGYIVPGNSVTIVEGWRVSDDEVAKFYFSDNKKSYGAKKGKDKNLGIIGVAVFEEELKYQNMPTMFNDSYFPKRFFDNSGSTYFASGTDGGGSTICCSSMDLSSKEKSNTKNAKQELGTGWGNYKNSEVTTVEFDKQHNVDTTLEIFYNTRKELAKMGVQFKKPVYLSPQAFPGQYCKPPQN